jgi:hypothetical protein
MSLLISNGDHHTDDHHSADRRSADHHTYKTVVQLLQTQFAIKMLQSPPIIVSPVIVATTIVTTVIVSAFITSVPTSTA